MKTTYMLYLALCLMAFASVVFSAPVCGDGIVAHEEGCDDKNTVSGDGCSATCLIENNYDCYNTTDQPSKCFDLLTVNNTLLQIRLKHLFFTTGQSIKAAFDKTKIVGKVPVITTTVSSGHWIFSSQPAVDAATGDIVWTIEKNLTLASESVTLEIKIKVGEDDAQSGGSQGAPSKREIEYETYGSRADSKRDISYVAGSGYYETFKVTATYCPLEQIGTDSQLPIIQPNKKLTCYRSLPESDIYLLKRVNIRPITEFQPGDSIDKGVLDCNCNYIRTSQ